MAVFRVPALVSDVEALKQQAGIIACDFVQEGMKIGLGTGSTVRYTVLELGRRMQEEGLSIVGVPTSEATRELAENLNIANYLPKNKAPRRFFAWSGGVLLGLSLPKKGCGSPAPVIQI